MKMNITRKKIFSCAVMKGITFIVSVLMLSVGIGCTHQMEITNLSAYHVKEIASTPFDVAITSSDYSYEEVRYIEPIISALRNHPHINLIRTGWSDEKSESGFNPSHLIKLEVKPEYKGDGANWVITWPGCYIFTCAWAGYVYHANIETLVTVEPSCQKAKNILQTDGFKIEPITANIRTNFDMRHCNFGRGFWSGSGWWMPGWGLHNIVTGIFFTNYEQKATEPFHKAVDDTYGKYIANKIVELLRDGGAIKYKQHITKK